MARAPATAAARRPQEVAVDTQMLEKIRTGRGFIAALDQSGGVDAEGARALRHPRVGVRRRGAMFDLVHAMRARIMTSPSFDGDRILAAILFEQTMDREIDGLGSAEHLWTRKHVVPVLKVDKGLEDEAHGVADDEADAGPRRRPGAGAGARGVRHQDALGRAAGRPESASSAVVAQQFEVAHEILEAGLVPIIEPEVDIHSPGKAGGGEAARGGAAGRTSTGWRRGRRSCSS